MSTFTTQASEAAEQYFAAVNKAQDSALEAVSTFAANVPDAAKNVPALPANDLPTPEEISAAYFSFTEKLVENQKDYTARFFAAATPAFSPARPAPPVPPAPPAPHWEEKMTAARADFIPDSLPSHTSASHPMPREPENEPTNSQPATVIDMTARIADRQIIDEAKRLLMTSVNLTEPEAHRWIQKTAMDRRAGKLAIALGIIEALSERA